jgi:hypothetical protein
MKVKFAIYLVAGCLAVGFGSYKAGERAAAGACVRNSEEAPVIWNGDAPSCPAGFDLVADEEAAHAGLDSAHCVR